MENIFRQTFFMGNEPPPAELTPDDVDSVAVQYEELAASFRAISADMRQRGVKKAWFRTLRKMQDAVADTKIVLRYFREAVDIAEEAGRPGFLPALKAKSKKKKG